MQDWENLDFLNQKELEEEPRKTWLWWHESEHMMDFHEISSMHKLSRLQKSFQILSYFCNRALRPTVQFVTNDQVTRDLSLITGTYATLYLARVSKILVWKPSIMSQRTKIGLRWYKMSLIKAQSQFKILIKISSHGMKTIKCVLPKP